MVVNKTSDSNICHIKQQKFGTNSLTNDKYVKIWQNKHPKLYTITFYIHHQKWVLWQGKHFPIHQMKPCQMDWRKLVILEKCILLKRILVISYILQSTGQAYMPTSLAISSLFPSAFQHKALQAIQPMMVGDMPDCLWKELAANFIHLW